MKEKELWIGIKSSHLLFYAGTNSRVAVQPWMKNLTAWIPQPLREAHTVGQAGTSCHSAACGQMHLYEFTPS